MERSSKSTCQYYNRRHCLVSNHVRDLLRKIASLGLVGPITPILDMARYQHVALDINLAALQNIRLQFLPSYSPNLNLIERLWKFIKRDVLYGRHYNNFAEFCNAIDGCRE